MGVPLEGLGVVKRARRGWESFPESGEGFGDPSGEPGGFERTSRRAERGW